MSEAVVAVGGWASPFVMRVSIALKVKGVEYEFLQEEIDKKSALLLRSNPVHKKMPVLLHAGRPVCESLVILEYIEDAFAAAGPRILPADPYARAVHRFWADYADAKHTRPGCQNGGNRLTVVINHAERVQLHSTLRTLRGMAGGDNAEAAETVAAALRQLEDTFAECSQGKGFFGGVDVGFLDIVLGSYIGWFRAAERVTGLPVLDEATAPRLAAWAARFCAHGAVGDLMPDADKLVQFGEALRAALAANASSRP